MAGRYGNGFGFDGFAHIALIGFSENDIRQPHEGAHFVYEWEALGFGRNQDGCFAGFQSFGQGSGSRFNDISITQHIKDGDPDARGNLKQRKVAGQSGDMDGISFSFGHVVSFIQRKDAKSVGLRRKAKYARMSW